MIVMLLAMRTANSHTLLSLLHRAGDRYETQLRRGRNVLRLREESVFFLPYAKNLKLPKDASPATINIRSLIKDHVRQNFAYYSQPTTDVIQSSINVIRTFSERTQYLSSMSYDLHAECCENDIRIKIETQYASNRRYTFVLNMTNEHASNSRRVLHSEYNLLSGSGRQVRFESFGIDGNFPELAPGTTYTHNSFVEIKDWYHGTLSGRIYLFDLTTRRIVKASVGPVALINTKILNQTQSEAKK